MPKTQCDLEATKVVVELLQHRPHDQRNAEWIVDLLTTLPYACLALGEPNAIAGPDGFPYLHLQAPEADKPFQALCILDEIEQLTLKGLGVVIDPQSESSRWVLTAGDVLQLRLSDSLVLLPNAYSPGGPLEGNFLGSEAEEVLLAPPSEEYLPTYTRHLLRAELAHLGIEHPGVALMARTFGSGAAAGVQNHLSFLLPGVSEANIDGVLRHIAWHLPQHYVILGPIGGQETHYTNL
jgi:hypothetical protein